MGFYYGVPQPPPPGDKPEGFKETVAIIWAVFSVLAVPLGIIFGTLGAVAAVVMLFAFNVLAGGAAIFAIVATVAAYGVWEARHPPKPE